jgi:hypothetical protein
VWQNISTEWIPLLKKSRFERLCGRIAGAFAKAGISGDEVVATLPGARERVYQRLYGTGARKGKPKKIR